MSKNRLANRFSGALILISLIWIISIANFLGFLPSFVSGLLPRHMSGLQGIVTMPFLHADFIHLISNTVPFVIFSILISLSGERYYFKSTILIVVLTGALLWLMGRESYHIGASGLVFGYFGFLLIRMFYSPSLMSIVISIAVLILYGGMIWGILPQGRQISWEGHLFGLIAGIIVARMMHSKTKSY